MKNSLYWISATLVGAGIVHIAFILLLASKAGA